MKTIVGLFDTREDAERAMNELLLQGWSNDDISLIVREDVVRDGAGRKEPDSFQRSVDAGFAGGGLVGGLAGLAIGLTAILVPGVGPILVTGTLGMAVVAAVTGGAVGALSGSLFGMLLDLGVSEDEAHAYAEGVKRGGIAIAVQVDDARAIHAMSVLHRAGAVDVEERRTQWQSQGWSHFDEAEGTTLQANSTSGVWR